MAYTDETEPKIYNLFDLLPQQQSVRDPYQYLQHYMPGSLRIIEAIEVAGGSARIVGGAIRNALIGYKLVDFDIVSSFEPERNINILKDIATRIILTGIKHGTITLIIDGTIIEVTSLRRDIKSYGRAADVEYTASWYHDALRRDFTVNAISMDKYCTLYDYFDGICDIKNRIIRFVNDPKQRIKEDSLRILRYFRFCSYFGFKNIHRPSYDAAKGLASNMKNLSGERIKIEMWKMLSIAGSLNMLYHMYKDSILQHIMLGLKYISEKEFDQIAFLPEEPLINLAALMFFDNAKDADIDLLSRRWKLSNKEKKILQKLCLPQKYLYSAPSQYRILHLENEPLLHEKFLFYVGYDFYKKMVKFLNVINKRKHDSLIESLLKHAKVFSQNQPQCPINGNDVIKYGTSDYMISHYLNHIHSKWVESGFALSRQDLLEELSRLSLKEK